MIAPETVFFSKDTKIGKNVVNRTLCCNFKKSKN